jgi:hypothetical protein
MAWDLLLLPAPTADAPSSPTPRPKEPTHPSSNYEHGILDMAIQWYHRRSDRSQNHNGRYFSSWNDLTVKKSASKSSAVSAQEGGILYWPACWVAYKRKPGRAQSLVCSQRSTPPHPLWTQPELHHLDTVCWISKFPMVNSVIFLEHALINRGALISINQANLSAPWSTGARSYPSIRQTWARSSQVNAPLSINQANLSAPLSSEGAPLKWARPFPSIRQTWARPSQKGTPFPIHQTVSQELRMNGGMAKPGPACRNWTRTHTLQ